MIFLVALAIYMYLVGIFLSFVVAGSFEEIAQTKGRPPKEPPFIAAMVFLWPFSWIFLFIYQVLGGKFRKKPAK